MQAFTIRGLDPELKEQLKQAAATQGKSTNRFILEIIRKELGLEKEKGYSKEYQDLDHLFGRWSEEEYQTISQKLEQGRNIDQELWG